MDFNSTQASEAVVRAVENPHGIAKVHIRELGAYLKQHNARLVRNRYQKTPVRNYLSQIEPVTLAQQYLEFYDAHPAFRTVCAGAKHHHWWEGGLEDHVSEMIGIGLDLMELYAGDIAFSRTDLIVACFLHDFAKIWGYRPITDEDRKKDSKLLPQQQFTYVHGVDDLMNQEHLILLRLSRAGITPSDLQWSAVLFAEGGYSDENFGFKGITHTSDMVMHRNQLAVIMHMADIYSSQILGGSLV